MRGAEGIGGGRSGEIERNKQAHIKPVSFFFPPLPPSLSLPLSHHYSSIRSWAAQLFQDVRTTKLPWMRECGAQGCKGVWNSWASGGASCSLALQPLAGWDKTGMSGWGVLCMHVYRDAEQNGVRECFCLHNVGGMTEITRQVPTPKSISWVGRGWRIDQSVMFKFISGSDISVSSGWDTAQWHVGYNTKKELSKE